MPTRNITVDGRTWRVFPSGRITPLHRDEFALMFVHGEGDAREVRVARYSPHGARWREQSLAELGDDDLLRLFQHSQPGDTSPEAGYAKGPAERQAT
jgi:hypothetical protein